MPRIARGQCIEGYGSKEAYYPMLEALAGLCRGDGGDAIVQILAGAPAGERYPTGSVTTTRTGVGLNPLHGLRICGQFETTASTRVSARRSTKSPGFDLPSTIPMVPSASTGTFMKKLILATMSFSPNPCRASARRKLESHEACPPRGTGACRRDRCPSGGTRGPPPGRAWR